jgi:hypothetical protein
MKPLNVPIPFAKDGIGVLAQARLAHQLVRSLWLPEDLGHEERQSRVSAAMALLEGIKPEDPIEGMLAVQMIATHEAAMECLRRSMLPGQTFEGRDQTLRNAAKLMGSTNASSPRSTSGAEGVSRASP